VRVGINEGVELVPCVQGIGRGLTGSGGSWRPAERKEEEVATGGRELGFWGKTERRLNERGRKASGRGAAFHPRPR
jgi:hypothetical protein